MSSDGPRQTDATGIEADLAWRAGRHTLEIAGAWGRHRYAFTRDAGRGERIVRRQRRGHGTALAGAAPTGGGPARRSSRSFEVAYIGSHFINAANTARYGGHALLNWRGDWVVTPRLRLFARLLNVLDAAYADRADFAFGSYRYFPGMPRQVYLGVSVRFSRP